MDKKLFKTDPRDFALKLVEDGLVSADTLIIACLKYMSHDDVRDMLDANELSPRFEEPDHVYNPVGEDGECVECGENCAEEI